MMREIPIMTVMVSLESNGLLDSVDVTESNPMIEKSIGQEYAGCEVSFF